MGLTTPLPGPPGAANGTTASQPPSRGISVSAGGRSGDRGARSRRRCPWREGRVRGGVGLAEGPGPGGGRSIPLARAPAPPQPPCGPEGLRPRRRSGRQDLPRPGGFARLLSPAV